jgi:hypothetical protein
MKKTRREVIEAIINAFVLRHEAASAEVARLRKDGVPVPGALVRKLRCRDLWTPEGGGPPWPSRFKATTEEINEAFWIIQRELLNDRRPYEEVAADTIGMPRVNPAASPTWPDSGGGTRVIRSGKEMA